MLISKILTPERRERLLVNMTRSRHWKILTTLQPWKIPFLKWVETQVISDAMDRREFLEMMLQKYNL